jgi:hypothetical protein
MEEAHHGGGWQAACLSPELTQLATAGQRSSRRGNNGALDRERESSLKLALWTEERTGEAVHGGGDGRQVSYATPPLIVIRPWQKEERETKDGGLLSWGRRDEMTKAINAAQGSPLLYASTVQCTRCALCLHTFGFPRPHATAVVFGQNENNQCSSMPSPIRRPTVDNNGQLYV